MATKNIGRSALEGGRYTYNKYERNASHRHERARARAWLSKVHKDIEYAEESVPQPRDKVYKGFTDKLNPCYRWLQSHVGQPWDEVYAKLTKAFDTRKLSAWHIVRQHMVPEVKGAGGEGSFFRSWTYFHIDENGLLQGDYPYREYPWRRKQAEYKGPSHEVFLAWIDGRRVIDYGASQFWAEPTQKAWVQCSFPRSCILPADRHRKIDVTSASREEHYSTGKYASWRKDGWWREYRHEHYTWTRWRQGRRFTGEERAFWRSAKESFRESRTISVSLPG